MWQFVFWLSVGVIAYTYIGYPLILILVNRLRRRSTVVSGGEEPPSLCLIVSAFNEEKVIRRKIENSLSLDYPSDRYTVLLASDGSTDRTVAIATEYSDRGLKIFHHPVRAGKSAALNEVVAKIDADIVAFTDANSIFADDALRRLVERFRDPGIGCVVGTLRYEDRHTSSVGKGEGIYWRYERSLSMLESSLQSVLVANGSIFAIRRHLFSHLYPEVANDFQMPADVASQGFGVVYEPSALAYERSTFYWREEFERKVRIILRGLTGYSVLHRKIRGLRRWQFVSHKLLRWAVGPLLFVAFFANAMLFATSAFYTLTFLLQTCCYIAAINGWRMRRAKRPHPVFYLPFYFAMVNFAAVIAITKFLSGERQVVWEKAESARLAAVRLPERHGSNGDGAAHPASLDAGLEATPQRVAKT